MHSDDPAKKILQEMNYDIELAKKMLPILEPNEIDLLDPKAVLLTGTSGFLGVHLLDELIKGSEVIIYCLLHEEVYQKAMENFRQSLFYYNLEHLLDNPRIIFLLGDLSKPQLGQTDEMWEYLTEKIDKIYHNGALVHHLLNYSSLRSTNVLSTIEMLKLAMSGKQKHICYMSTLGTTMFNKTSPTGKENGYVLSKWVSENILNLASERNFAISIYRPPQIVGHSKTGASPTDDVNILLFMKACVRYGMAPNDMESIPMLPVDYVARFIIESSLQNYNKAYNLLNGNQPRIEHFFELLVNNWGYTINLMPKKEWGNEIMKRISMDDPFFPLLSLYLESETTMPTGNGIFPQLNAKCLDEFLVKGTNIVFRPSKKLIDICFKFLDLWLQEGLQQTNNKIPYIDRELGLFEIIQLSVSQQAAFNIIGVARITGDLKPLVLKEALDVLQKRYPILGSRIDILSARPRFTNTNVYSIPLEVITKKDDENEWVRIKNQELNTNFDLAFGSLMRAKYLIGDTYNEIILTWHHMISDGVSSAYFFKDLLSIASSIKSGSHIPFLLYPSRPPVEKILPKVKHNAGNITSTIAKVPQECPINLKQIDDFKRLTIHAKTYLLSEEQTSSLVERCRSHKVTVQGFLCANLMLNLYKSFTSIATIQGSSQMDIICNTLVDLRSMLGISVEEMGCYIGAVDTYHKITTNMNLWYLAREINTSLKYSVDNQQHLQKLTDMTSLLEGEVAKGTNLLPFLSTLLLKREQLIPKVVVTNVGKIDITKNYDGFCFENLYGGVSGGALYMSKSDIILLALTCSNKLHLTFHGTSDSYIELVKNNFIEQLNKVIVPENKKLIFTSLADEKVLKPKIEHEPQLSTNKNDNGNGFSSTPRVHP